MIMDLSVEYAGGRLRGVVAEADWFLKTHLKHNHDDDDHVDDHHHGHDVDDDHDHTIAIIIAFKGVIKTVPIFVD